MRRRTLLGSFLTVFAGTYPRLASALGVKPVAPGIYRLSGKVEVNGVAAREGSIVNPGDTVVTGERSEAIYVVGEDAFLQREKSTVTLTGTAVTTGLRLASGKLLSVFGKGEKRLQTATATIGIRGTACYMEIRSEQTYFCLCYGIAEITPSVRPDRREVIQTQYHDRPLLISADPERPYAVASVENHTDNELILLENLVGRYPPFFGKQDLYRY